MEYVKIVHNLLNDVELDYLNSLITNQSIWKHRTSFDQLNARGEKLWFDSIHVDNSKLENYNKTITEDGKFYVIETAINIITTNRQITDSDFHTDSSDLSYVTYLNNDFDGGDFVYRDYEMNLHRIKPIKGMSIKINSKTPHKVENVESGVRFSLYSFLGLPSKNLKTFI